MASLQLDHLLARARNLNFLRLKAETVREVLGSPEPEPVLGARVALGQGEDSFHLLDAASITWPEFLFVHAEFDTGATSTVETLNKFLAKVEPIHNAEQLIKKAQSSFFSDIGAKLGLGVSRAQALEQVRSFAPLLESTELEDLAHVVKEICDRADSAARAQKQGVALFPGVHGASDHYVEATQLALTDALGAPPEATVDVLDRKYVVPAHSLVRSLVTHPDSAYLLHDSILGTLRNMTEAKTMELLGTLDPEKLKDVTNERLRFAGLDEAGITSVADVLLAPVSRLTAISGIGEQTALRMKAAAQTLHSESMAQPINSIGDERTSHSLSLLETLAIYESTGLIDEEQSQRRDRLVEYFHDFPDYVDPFGPPFVIVRTGDSFYSQFIDDIAWAGASPTTFLPQQRRELPVDIWADYQSRPAHYQGLLSSLLAVGQGAGENNSFGLSEDILSKIRTLKLDNSKLKDLHLRGYQSFGAKFCLVQKKAILGDEMGLGKTVQTLSALCHLSAHYDRDKFSEKIIRHAEKNRAQEDNEEPTNQSQRLNPLDIAHGDSRDKLQSATREGQAPTDAPIIVVVPASLIMNWKREIEKFTTLKVYLAHGSARDDALSMWVENGGALILTYDGARTLSLPPAHALVVDEAHMIKNPEAKRSQAVAALINDTEYAFLLTGTPMENKVGEFAQLVRYIKPNLLPEENNLRPRAFREAIAPAYLRRNQTDVLDELPEKVEHMDWVQLTEQDQRFYAEAIEQSNWMAARRAAMQAPSPLCAKIERIKEIVHEAHQEQRNVLIFSYFKDVLERLSAEFGDLVVGTISGSVPPVQRQHMVDALGANGCVLLAQIGAGGVGLNIQKASVVILAEVQVKPTIEDQAIARAHRLGQMSVVNVHRIIGDDTVDERLLEITAAKRKNFDSFARESESADVPDAVDISETQLAARIIAEEKSRLGF